MEIVVEILGTTGNVLERHRFDRRQVSIGRGYRNDVIVTDEHVDAEHARLEVDDEGTLRIRDRGSVNGLRRIGRRGRVNDAPVRSGDRFLLGRTRVRILLPGHPVPPAVRIRLAERLLLALGRPLVVAGLLLAWLAAITAETWIATIGEFRWTRVVEDHQFQMLGFVALAVGVYFLSVLFRRGGHFLAHLGLLIVLFLAGVLFDASMEIARFNAGDRAYPWLDGLAAFADNAVLFVYLWGVLYLAFHLSLVRRSLVALSGVLVIFALETLPEPPAWMNAEATFPLESAFLPPGYRIVSPMPPDRVETRMDALFDIVAEDREQSLAERDGDGTP